MADVNRIKPEDISDSDYMTISHSMIKLDISDEACLIFGFRHGDRVVIAEKWGKHSPRPPFKVTIVGVAPEFIQGGPNVLWFTADGRGSLVSYLSDPRSATWTLLKE